MGLWLCDWSKGSTEKCVGLQLCVPVPTLGCHYGFTRPVIFLDKRATPSKVGWKPSLHTRPGFLQKVFQLSTPHRQPVVKWQHAAQHVITGQIRLRSRQHYGVRHHFVKCTHWFHINFSDLQHTNYVPTKASVGLLKGTIWIQVIIMVADVTKTKSPMTRVCFSMGVSSSRENQFETWTGVSLIVGYDLALCPHRVVTWPPDCSWSRGIASGG